MAADANNNMALTSSPYVLEDKVSGNTIANTAANYRIGLYPASGWTVDKAIKALRFERRIELAMEGIIGMILCAGMRLLRSWVIKVRASWLMKRDIC